MRKNVVLVEYVNGKRVYLGEATVDLAGNVEATFKDESGTVRKISGAAKRTRRG